MIMTEIQIYRDYISNGKTLARVKALAEMNDTTMENIKEIIQNQSVNETVKMMDKQDRKNELKRSLEDPPAKKEEPPAEKVEEPVKEEEPNVIEEPIKTPEENTTPKSKGGRPKGAKNRPKNEENEMKKGSTRNNRSKKVQPQPIPYIDKRDDISQLASFLGNDLAKGYLIGTAFNCLKNSVSNSVPNLNEVIKARDYLNEFIELSNKK